MSEKLLLIEDDEDISQMLSTLLVNEGFHVESAMTGTKGEALAITGIYDAIILDIMLPEKDGLSVLRDIRGKITTPILMLTAKGDDVDRIIGFEMGADDYLPKPFNPRELVARVKALLRRVNMDKAAPPTQNDININNLVIKPKTRQVYVEGEPAELTGAEYNVLKTLISNPDAIISREELTEKALGRKLTLYDRAIDMHLSNLRKKISDKAIKTVRGAGYIYQTMES